MKRSAYTLALILSLGILVTSIATAQQQQPAAPSAGTRPAGNTSKGTNSGGGAVITTGPEVAASAMVQEVDAAGVRKLLTRGEGAAARPLLLNVWATWCGPCREEFPDLVKLDEDYRSRGLDFYTLSVDDVAEIKTAVPTFLQQMRARMPAYLLNAPEPMEAINHIDATWSGEVPATFLFDRTGQLVFKHSGRIKPDELRAAIDKAIGEK